MQLPQFLLSSARALFWSSPSACKKSRAIAAGLAAATCIVAPPAAASENQFFSGIQAFGDILIPDKTHVTVGLGPVFRPDYVGSNDYQIAAEPALYLRFEGFLTLENDGASINLLGLGNFEFGPTARVTRGRGENDNPDLTGLGDVGLSFDVGLYLKAKISDKYAARLRYTHAIINNSNGGLLDLRLSTVLYRENKLTLAAALEGDWITSGRAQRFFGVTTGQSALSSKPVYTPGSSFRDVNLALLAQYSFSDKWSINGLASYMRLVGGAADSPIVRSVGSPNQFTIGASLSYRFSITAG